MIDFDFNWRESEIDYISIGANKIYLGANAVKKLNYPKLIKIGFDKTNMELCFEAVEDAGTVAVYKLTNKQTITSREICKYINKLVGNKYEESIKYRAEMKGNALIAKLNMPLTAKYKVEIDGQI